MQNLEEQITKIEELLLAQKRILNVDELSRYTGLSKSFLWKLTAAKKIPHSCPNGKLLFFDRLLIEQWLLSNPISTVDDVEQEAINYITAKPWKAGKA